MGQIGGSPLFREFLADVVECVTRRELMRSRTKFLLPLGEDLDPRDQRIRSLKQRRIFKKKGLG
jgi:hypothetical protein